VTLWKTVYRWVGAVLAVVALFVVLVLVLGRNLTDTKQSIGPTQRRINRVADLGDDGATACEHDEIKRGMPAPAALLRRDSTACVVVGVVDDAESLRWFFIGRGNGAGLVRVPKPVRVGLTVVALSNGAVVPMAKSVAVRCSPDPNERFEVWVADGRATAGYLNEFGALVAIDCEQPT